MWFIEFFMQACQLLPALIDNSFFGLCVRHELFKGWFVDVAK